MKIKILVFLIVILAASLNAQSKKGSELKRQADAEYLKENYEKAEKGYQESLKEEARAETHFNLGNALYRQQKFEEALEQYRSAADLSGDETVQSDALYNLGNSLFETENMKDAVDAYRQALLRNPSNEEARNNYLLSKQMLQSKMEQEGESNDDSSNGEEQESESQAEENGDSDQESEGMDDIAEGNREEPGEKSIDGNQEKESISAQEERLDEGRLEQLLEIAEEEDQQSRRKMNEQSGAQSQTLKDW